MQPYENLRVAKQARTLIKSTYAFTRTLPREEQFELSSQMRRAAISFGLNIAEGASRQTTKEFIRFLEVARGSGMELHFAAVVSADLELGRSELRSSLLKELESGQKQLSALVTSLRRRSAEGSRR
jgi:four helix bundle protein